MQAKKNSPKRKGDSESRFDTIYTEIRNRIRLLDYPPGMALREEALAEEFGVSRTPIRHVLQRLEFEGLVSTSRGTGSIVTTVDIRSLKEVYALRLRLVELAGEFPSSHFSPDLIDTLKTLLEQCEQYYGDYNPRALASLYNNFHDEMLAVIGNRPLKRISDQLFHHTARVWLQILPDLDWGKEVGYIEEEISDVIDALSVEDLSTVSDIRGKHMAMLLERIRSYLSGTSVQQQEGR